MTEPRLGESEPVRLGGYVALVAGLILLGLIGWASDLTVKQIVLQLATVALTQVGGLEWARAHAVPKFVHDNETRHLLSLLPPPAVRPTPEELAALRRREGDR